MCPLLNCLVSSLLCPDQSFRLWVLGFRVLTLKAQGLIQKSSQRRMLACHGGCCCLHAGHACDRRCLWRAFSGCHTQRTEPVARTWHPDTCCSREGDLGVHSTGADLKGLAQPLKSEGGACSLWLWWTLLTRCRPAPQTPNPNADCWASRAAVAGMRQLKAVWIHKGCLSTLAPRPSAAYGSLWSLLACTRSPSSHLPARACSRDQALRCRQACLGERRPQALSTAPSAIGTVSEAQCACGASAWRHLAHLDAMHVPRPLNAEGIICC